APIDLLGELIGTPQPGGSWSGPDPITGTFDPAVHSAGIYTYTVAGNAACPDAFASIDITVPPAADAGSDATVSVCASDAAIDLFGELGGTPDIGGTWSGPSAINGSYDPALHQPGAYVYSIAGSGSCPGASATITVSASLPGDAGEDATLDLCSNSSAVDLFASLGGTPQSGGSWSGPDVLTGGSFDPATDQPGIYTYAIAASDPCPQVNASVTVTVEVAPDAGADGAVTVCEVGGSIDLFQALNGTPGTGGTWSGPSAITGNYDPASHDPGVYTYSIQDGATCSGSSATVTVTETGSPDAGDDQDISLCSSDGPIDLFDQLGGTPDAGGEWSGPAGPFNGILDPATAEDAIYTYSIDATAPCSSDQASITITINPAPDAGTDAAITICENGGDNNLFSSLGGSPQPGGTWSSVNGAFTGLYDPAVNEPGDFTYTIPGTAPCGSSSAVVTVIETGSPNAGSDAMFSLCPDDAAVDLFTLLTGAPDLGGTWSGPSPTMTGTFDPAVHSEGVYTYSIEATAPCTSDASTVTVNIVEGADAGVDAAITVCASGDSVDLFDALNGTPQPGGSWSGPSAITDGTFDPTIHLAGIYTYTVAGIGSCGPASAVIEVTITTEPDAGTDATLVICSNGTPVDLFAFLGGTPDAGGVWSGPVPMTDGLFDPFTDPSGVYTYSISAAAPCIGDQATVTITVEPEPAAGTSTNFEVCPGAPVQDLFDLLGNGADVGGSWSGPVAGFDGTYDPALYPAGIYTYTVSGVECANASAAVTVAILDGANAGADAQINICSSDQAFEMLTELGGTPDAGGIWTNSSGATVPSILAPATATSATFTYTVTGSAQCPTDQATLQVTISVAPQAGISGILEMCSDEGQVSLFDGLTGTLDAGGIWTDPNGVLHATVVDPLVDIAGTYTYTVTSGVCASATATVNVIIYSAPDAGDNNAVAFCTNEGGVSLMSLLQGSPDPGGTWIGPDGEPQAAMFLPASNEPGVYTYMVSGGTACGIDEATITISVSDAANAGTGGSISICQNDATVALFDQLNGTPEPGGTWTAPDGSSFSGTFVPSIDLGGEYVYSIQPEEPCASVSAIITVDLLPVPSPTISVTNADGCAPVEVTISHDYEGSATCTWMLGNGNILEDCSPVTVIFDEAGSYDISLIIDAGNGCGANTIEEIGLVNVHDKPTAAFEAFPEIIGTNVPEAYFHNYSEGASNYLWDMAGMATYNSVNVNHIFPAQLGDEYEVCLIAYASAQCADTICKTITVNDALSIHVPNAFSPDGNDINDRFKPVLAGVDAERYLFMIFDRWGTEIFATTDPNAEWDGRSASGDEIQQGVYVWKVHLKDRYSGERVEQIGHVTLIR
ncbi:MAG: gliding motility-associated C-terminal domain-containing protein, partial [Bacteroidota bacterium]|nr:gliding motility-associated C-terminal domain-containing protein [Bacteroidota bacterium]